MSTYEQFNKLIESYKEKSLDALEQENFNSKDEAEQFAILLYHTSHLNEAIKQYTIQDPKSVLELLYSIVIAEDPSKVMLS